MIQRAINRLTKKFTLIAGGSILGASMYTSSPDMVNNFLKQLSNSGMQFIQSRCQPYDTCGSVLNFNSLQNRFYQ